MLTALVAVAGQQLEEGPLDVRIPAEVHYRGVLRGQGADPRGCSVRWCWPIRRCAECLQETARTHGVDVRRSDDDPVDAAARRADRIKSALAKLTS